MGHVMSERSEGRCPRRSTQRHTLRERGDVHPCKQSRGNRFHIAFHAANLSCEKDLRMRFHLQGRLKQRGRVDVSVAMDLAVTQEPRIFESGNQAQDSGLLSELEMILKSDKVVGVGAQVLLAQLKDDIGSFAQS